MQEPLINIRRVRWPVFVICGFIFFVFLVMSIIFSITFGYKGIAFAVLFILTVILSLILYFAHYERIFVYRDYFVHRRLGHVETVRFSDFNRIVKGSKGQFNHFEYQYSTYSYAFFQGENQKYGIDALLFNAKTANQFFGFIEKNHPHIFIER